MLHDCNESLAIKGLQRHRKKTARAVMSTSLRPVRFAPTHNLRNHLKKKERRKIKKNLKPLKLRKKICRFCTVTASDAVHAQTMFESVGNQTP